MKTIVNILTGDQGEVKKFILANVDINCRDRNCKSTPLHMAAKGNHIEVVETLLKHGADITLRDVRKYFTHVCVSLWFFLLLRLPYADKIELSSYIEILYPSLSKKKITSVIKKTSNLNIIFIVKFKMVL